MSVDGIYNNLSSMMTVQQGEQADKAQGHKAEKALSALTDSISLSSVDPKLRSVLENISEQGGNVLEALENNINTLQEGFLDSFHQHLEEAGIDTSKKISLRLAPDETLVVQNSHPDAEAIDAIIKDNPELQDAFKEIAAQSEIVRDIRNIRKVVGNRSGGVASYAQAAQDAGVHETYKMSMRGPMSHFYFSPE